MRRSVRCATLVSTKLLYLVKMVQFLWEEQELVSFDLPYMVMELL